MSIYRLILMRHAKAEPASGAGDHVRPLSPRGLAEAAEAGRRLAAMLRPDHAIVSDSARTRQTFERLAPAFDPAPSHQFTKALYGVTDNGLLAAVRKASPEIGCLLVIGHNPGIGDLARRLAVTGDRRALETLARGFPTSCFAVLSFDAGDWSAIRADGHLDYLLPADERAGS